MSQINDRLKDFDEKLSDESSSELLNRIKANAEYVTRIIDDNVKDSFNYPEIICRKDDLSFDKMIFHGTHIEWKGQEYVIALMEPEECIAQSLVDDVLSYKYIPCAIGQMPEDFIFLADRNRDLKVFYDEDYKGNNNPDYNKYLGCFIIHDNHRGIGWGYRATYDDKHWRWEDSDHCNYEGFPKASEKINEQMDEPIKFWKLIKECPNKTESAIINLPF